MTQKCRSTAPAQSAATSLPGLPAERALDLGRSSGENDLNQVDFAAVMPFESASALPKQPGWMRRDEMKKRTDTRSPHIGAASAPEENARGRLLRAAAELFCRYGINATGVDAVVASAGTAKATLYKTFGSKEGLVEAVLEAEGAAWRDWFLGEIDAIPGAPGDKLLGLFDVLERWFGEERFFGCPFINAVGEFDKRETRYKSIALEHKKIVKRRIAELVADTGMSAPGEAAHQIGLLVDGAIVAALITGDATIARQGRAATAKVLAAAT